MNEKKKLLFITTRLPFPTTSGRKTSLYNYCKIMKELGYELIVASFNDDSDISLKPDFIDELIILPNPKKITKIFNILKDSFLTQKFPLQVSLYYDKKIQKKIDDIVEKKKPDIVIADMVRTTEYIKNLKNVITVADLDDRLSLRYERQLKCDINEVNPYGLFLNSLPRLIQKIAMLNIIKKNVMKNEIKLLKKYELNVGNATNYTIFVAENETRNFNKELGKDKALTVPIGVDIEYYNNKNFNKIKEDYIGFLGVLNVSHNENAVKGFIKNILPIILKGNNNIKFMVIGGGASKELLDLQSDSVIFTDRVDDVREYLRKCKVFVCPLNFGSGIKTKNLEAMALGLPIVTTTIGAENINAIHKKDWYVADDKEEFAKYVLDLIENENLREEMGNNAEKYIRENWTWSLAKKSLKKILK